MWTKLNLARLAPGLASLLDYRREWWRADLRAGLSVAAVALPVAIAYAALAGVSPIAGLYSCILPMLVYALFGSSRQLMIGPDAATCAVIAAVVTPLAAGDPVRHWQLVVVLTLMTGIWCLLGSRLRFGTLADFLSQPILMGLLNGVAITIMVGQLARIFGFHYADRGLIERLANSFEYLRQMHGPRWGSACSRCYVCCCCVAGNRPGLALCWSWRPARCCRLDWICSSLRCRRWGHSPAAYPTCSGRHFHPRCCGSWSCRR